MTYDSIKKTLTNTLIGAIALTTLNLSAENKNDLCAIQSDLTYSKDCVTDVFAAQKADKTLRKYSQDKIATVLANLNDNMDNKFLSKKIKTEEKLLLRIIGSPEYSFHVKTEAIELLSQTIDDKVSSKTKKLLAQQINPETDNGICNNLSNPENDAKKDLCMKFFYVTAPKLLKDGMYAVSTFKAAMEVSQYSNQDVTKSGPYKIIENKYVVDPRAKQQLTSSKDFNNFLKSKMALKNYLQETIEGEQYNFKSNVAADLYVKMRCKMGPQICIESKLFIKENNPKFYEEKFVKPNNKNKSSKKGKSRK